MNWKNIDWKSFAFGAASIILIAWLIPCFIPPWNDRVDFISKIVVPILGFVVTLYILRPTLKSFKTQTDQLAMQSKQLEDQAENARKQMAAEQFKNAIEHLGSFEQSKILGGIHALHNLATIDKSYRKQTLDILCSFVREETTRPGYKELIRAKNLAKHHRDETHVKKVFEKYGHRIVSTIVIQTIINLLFRQKNDREVYLSFPEPIDGHEWDYYRADLSEALLWEIDMWDADFRKVNFYRADLSSLNFRGSDLRGARLGRANCSAVKFKGAKFACISEERVNRAVSLLGAHTGDSIFGPWHIHEDKVSFVWNVKVISPESEVDIYDNYRCELDKKNCKKGVISEVFPIGKDSLGRKTKYGEMKDEVVNTLAKELGYLPER